MFRLTSLAAFVFAVAQTFMIGVFLPGQAAQNCGSGADWVQTGQMLGAGYCKPKHRKDHVVCVLDDLDADEDRCVRNSLW